MLSNTPCLCLVKTECGGRYTETELKMHEVRPEFSVQHYHEVLELFGSVFGSAQ